MKCSISIESPAHANEANICINFLSAQKSLFMFTTDCRLIHSPWWCCSAHHDTWLLLCQVVLWSAYYCIMGSIAVVLLWNTFNHPSQLSWIIVGVSGRSVEDIIVDLFFVEWSKISRLYMECVSSRIQAVSPGNNWRKVVVVVMLAVVSTTMVMLLLLLLFWLKRRYSFFFFWFSCCWWWSWREGQGVAIIVIILVLPS